MTVRGRKEGAAALCKTVTDREFLMLARDLLVMRGHTGIRVTDGPGDGQRDIHSFTPEDKVHITQVAHTRNSSRTIGSRKLAELPIAMVKFGAKDGLFVTSGRISPQAKREFLGDYPDLHLDFLDGDSTADEVLRNVPLKAIWYDGADFGIVSNRVRLSFLLRDLATERPLSLSEEAMKQPWRTTARDIEIQCRYEYVHASTFAPYRQPEAPSPYEGSSSILRVHEFVFSGILSLADFDTQIDTLSSQILERIRVSSTSPVLALRFGQAILVPLRGEWSGSSIRVGPRPFTVLSTTRGTMDEWTWLADVNESWVRQTAIHHVNADWVRRLHPDLDLCFAVNLVTSPTEDSLLQTASFRRVMRHDWERSVFCLVDATREADINAMNPPPSGRYAWPDGRIFVVWNLRQYLGPFAVTASADDDDDLGLGRHEQAMVQELTRMRQALGAAGHELIFADAARHMMALVDHDPIPSDRMHYRFVDLERGEPYPSPVEARGRWLTLDVCWRLGDELLDDTRREVEQWLKEWGSANGIAASCTHEFDYADGPPPEPSWYLHLQLVEQERDALRSTDERLAVFLDTAEPMFNAFQAGLADRGVLAKRATRDYWRAVCEIEFQMLGTGHAGKAARVGKAAATGKAATGKAATGKAATGKAAIGKAATGKAATGKAATDKAATDKAARVGKAAATGKAATGKAATGKAKVTGGKRFAPSGRRNSAR